jgi:hypothetical protein
MELIKPYIGIIYLIFILGYWVAIAILLYHLKRYGIGRVVQIAFYAILIVSIILTVVSGLFYLQI